MRLTLIALGAAAGCVVLASSAIAGPCTAQIDTITQKLAATDAGMGPTGAGAATGGEVTANAVSPSGAPQVPTTPATGTMNDASQNKATSSQDVQTQNTGQGTAADVATGAAAATTTGDTAGQATGGAAAAAHVQRAQQFDQAGNEAACMDEVTKAQDALTQ